ncbi:hypothetical protein NPIL_323321 [Nephila pilipes]|uniref:Uncharacterized protein n=1 Tax=Nephila pilipes TaxID=299642 RepID=A0A8X6JIU2_NEPPI|nr:hypothetical protein NPIL_323321 [Nephila pilipes]
MVQIRGKRLSDITQQTPVSVAEQWAEAVEILLSDLQSVPYYRRIILNLPKRTMYFHAELLMGAFRRYLLDEHFRNEVLMLGEGTDSMSLLIPDSSNRFIVNVQLMLAVVKKFVGSDEFAIIASQREMSLSAVYLYKELSEERHTLTGDFVIEEITKFDATRKKKIEKLVMC